MEDAIGAGAPFEVVGAGTKRALGRPMQTARTLDLSDFSGITLYEPEELVITAGAGTTLSMIEEALNAKGQMLAFEPPDLSQLLGSAHAGTIGGMLAANLSGPRRIRAGGVRDCILGIAGVSGRGEAFKAGGRVVKNVTGYDISKLMAGSFGTLAALTSLTFKVLPRPETEETLCFSGLDDRAAGPKSHGLSRGIAPSKTRSSAEKWDRRSKSPRPRRPSGAQGCTAVCGTSRIPSSF